MFGKLTDSWNEIGQDPHLRIMYWILWGGFFVAFYNWSYHSFGVIGETCWPYFTNCDSIRWLPKRSESYLYIAQVSFLFFTLLLSGYYFIRKEWKLSLSIFAFLAAFKLFTFAVLTFRLPGNFEYFHLLPVAAFLFLRPRKESMQVLVASLFFLATTMKFHEAWILGTYFTSLKLGLPFIPDELVPIATNLVISLEIFAPWLLFSSNNFLRKLSIASITFFLIYSVLLVGIHYQSFSLLPFLGLFVFDDLSIRQETSRRERIACLVVVCLVFLIHIPQFFVPKDNRYTMQSYRLGVWMFDSNHQCVSTIKIFNKNGTTEVSSYASNMAMNRCPAYPILEANQRLCKDNLDHITKISWTLDHSINGGPFYRIVDTDNACSLHYSHFLENDWLVSNPSDEHIVGYPRKNYPDRDEIGENGIIFDTPSIRKTPIQKTLSRFLNEIRWFWITLWWLVLLTMGLPTALRFYRSGSFMQK